MFYRETKPKLSDVISASEFDMAKGIMASTLEIALLCGMLTFMNASATIYTEYSLSESASCGSSDTVRKDDAIRLLGNEASNSTTCNVSVTSVPEDGCDGLCFMFHHSSVINNNNVTYVINNGTDVVTYSTGNPVIHLPDCDVGSTLTATITLAPGYVYNENATGFRLLLDVYHACGERGTARNIDFDEAIKHAKGFYHGDEFETQTKKAFFQGLGVGLGLAGMFVVMFVVGHCYTRQCTEK